MPLPLIPLPTTTVEVGGQQIPIRSLSRGERLALAELELDTRGVEAFIVARSTDVDDATALAWLASVTADVADSLISATMEWSGLIGPRAAATQEAADEPEDPSSGSTEEQGSGEPSSAP